MNQEINFWKVRDLGEIINVTFAFVKIHFKNLLTVLIYTAGPFLLLSAILSVWFQSNMVVPSMEERIDDPLSVLSFFTDPRFYLAIIAGMIGSFVLYAAMYSYVMMARDGHEPTPDTVWAQIRDDAGIYISTFFLLFGFYILSIPIIIIPCLGILVWLIGGVYLLTILQIYLPARLHERIGAFEAIKRCNELNKGHIVDSFLLLIVMIVIVVALGMVFLLPSMAVSFSYGLNSLVGNATTPLWASVLSTVCSMLGSLIAIVPITAMILHYSNLVERFESPGLADRVDNWADEQSDDLS